MINTETLEKLALKLNLTMSESEYNTLLDEFNIMLEQMNNIDAIEGISEVEPMSFPFPVTYTLKSDDVVDNMPCEDVLSNSSEVFDKRVVVPKVVGEENE